MSWLFHSLSSILTLIVLSGCKVGTDSQLNMSENTEEVKVLRDSVDWGKDIEPKATFMSDKRDGFKSYKVVVATENDEKYKSGIFANWLYNDDNDMSEVLAIIEEEYSIDIDSESEFYSEVSFSELNVSERVVFLGARLDEIDADIEIWIDKTSSITPKGEYLDDIIFDNQLYGIYKESNKIVLNIQSNRDEYRVFWRELILMLIEKDIIKTQKEFILKNISFGVKILRGEELIIIDRFFTHFSQIDKSDFE